MTLSPQNMDLILNTNKNKKIKKYEENRKIQAKKSRHVFGYVFRERILQNQVRQMRVHNFIHLFSTNGAISDVKENYVDHILSTIINFSCNCCFCLN